MALETKLSLKTAQRLVMTAMLQQAIKLLPLSHLELVQKVQQELLENPFLDDTQTQEGGEEVGETEGGDEEAALDTDNASQDPDIDWEAYIQDYGSDPGLPRERDAEVPSLEATLKSETSLTEYLLWQLSMSTVSDLERQVGAYLIGNINEDGYLECQVEEAAATCGVETALVQKMLALVQSFDPSGVGGRDLQECLLIQLRHLHMEHDVAGQIVQKYLSSLDERFLTKIAKELNASPEDVFEAMQIVRELDPQPGAKYSPQRVDYVVPDVMIFKVSDEYQVALNDEGMPRLRINTSYHDVLRHSDTMPSDTKAYLEDKFRSALWLLKSVEQRRQTLTKVAKSLCKFQREFLDKGLAYLKPLVLKDVAEDIGMHESTVSRVTTNKYVHTPQGVFELKFFFHSGLESRDGDAMSSVSVKEIIRKAVLAENAHKPLTDQQLAKLLEDKGIRIARRTIAKYRQELHILPAGRRKRITHV